jgi:hypothetical protein
LLEWDAKIPPFPVVHAEVLKARDYMTAELDDPACLGGPATQRPPRDAPQCPKRTRDVPAGGGDLAAVSNPLSFLVPEVEGSDSYAAGTY